MYNETFAYNDKDVQKDCSEIIHYVLINICKKLDKWQIVGQNNEWDYQIRTRFKEIDFMHVKWIIDRANFLCNKNFGLNVIPSVYIHDHNEAHFVPESFRLRDNHEMTYYMSGADIWCLNKVIFRWKLYGKYCVKLDKWWFNLTYNIKKLFKKGE